MILINVKICLKSSTNKLEKLSETEFIAYIDEVPENNKVNDILIKLVKKYFNKDNVLIIKGKKDRNKLLRIS